MAQLKDLLVTGAARFLNGLNINGDLTIAGNLLPAGTNTYVIGDSSHQWKQLQVQFLSVNSGDISSLNPNNYKAIITGDFKEVGNSLFDGNVGIGGTNNSYKLYVTGAPSRFNAALRVEYSTPNFYIRDLSTGANTYSAIRFGNSSNENAADIFLNGPSRTDGGGANMMTIRNNVGNLRLNNDVINTGRLSVAQSSVNTSYNLYINGTTGNPNGLMSFVQNNTIIGATTDFNTLTVPGCYKVQMSAWGAAETYHSPNEWGSIYSYGLLFVFRGSTGDTENRIEQIYFPHQTSNAHPVLSRMHNSSDMNSGWQTWHRLARETSNGTANRMAYYSGNQIISSAANMWTNGTKLGVNTTSEPTQNFYVNGTSYFNGNVSLNGAFYVTSLASKTTDFNTVADGFYHTYSDGNTTSYITNAPVANNGQALISITPYSATGDVRTVQLDLVSNGKVYYRSLRQGPTWHQMIQASDATGTVGSATVPVYSDHGVLKTITSYSGNAATATNADTVDGYHESSFLRYSGKWNSGSGQNVNDANGMVFAYSNHGLPGAWGIVTTLEYSKSNSYKHQIYGDGWNNEMYFRTASADRGGWNSWKRLVYESGTWGISITGNAATATTLQTARTIALGGNLQGSASFNGTGDITITALNYQASIGGGNTYNYPWHRIATATMGTGQYGDRSALLRIRHTYNGGGEGLVKVSVRTNSTGANCDISAVWLYRYNIAVNNIGIGLWGVTGDSVYVDVYYKFASGWPRAVVESISNGRVFTLVSSNEVDNTTTTDKKTSSEVYTSIENGATLIRGQDYTKIVYGSDGADNSRYVLKTGDTMTGDLTAPNISVNKYLKVNAWSGYGTGWGGFWYDGTNKKLLAYSNAGNDATLQASKVYGAVWNDYAEYRITNKVKPGQCVIETGLGDLVQSTKRLQPGANIVSDTFGFAIGETDTTKTPLAVSGRVLAYPNEDRYSYSAGDPVCSGPNGTISKMTREEVREYPDRIVGTVSEIPEYETWGTGNVKVNGRIWIKVK